MIGSGVGGRWVSRFVVLPSRERGVAAEKSRKGVERRISSATGVGGMAGVVVSKVLVAESNFDFFGMGIICLDVSGWLQTGHFDELVVELFANSRSMQLLQK